MNFTQLKKIFRESIYIGLQIDDNEENTNFVRYMYNGGVYQTLKANEITKDTVVINIRPIKTNFDSPLYKDYTASDDENILTETITSHSYAEITYACFGENAFTLANGLKLSMSDDEVFNFLKTKGIFFANPSQTMIQQSPELIGEKWILRYNLTMQFTYQSKTVYEKRTDSLNEVSTDFKIK